MGVVIRAVRCLGGGCEPVAFELPCVELARRTALEALARHPFVLSGVYDFGCDPGTCPVRLDVAVSDSGPSREYALGRLGAEILYDGHILDRRDEVELRLHLRCYLGESVEPRPCGELPPAEELVRRPFDEAGLRRTLWHEYGHLLDALRDAFQYDLAVKKGLSAYERAVLNELWNAYIDRRLARLSPEPDRPFFRPLAAHSRPALEMMLRGIWAEDRDWTYRELARAAADLPPR